MKSNEREERPLVIEMSGWTLHFTTLDDLRFALASRVEVPAGKLAELEALDADALEAQARDIRAAELVLVRILGDSLGEPLAITRALQSVDPRLFTTDHGWRALFRELARQPGAFDEFKRLALVSHLEYLQYRQDLIRRLHAVRSHETALVPIDRRAPAGSHALRETLLFHSSDLGGAHDRGKLRRLPRGERVLSYLAPGQEFTIYLESHPFRLVRGTHVHLVDASGEEHPIEGAHVLVGRHPDCDVVINPRYRGVSRRHVSISVLDHVEVEMVDLSSLGTFVPEIAFELRAEPAYGIG